MVGKRGFESRRSRSPLRSCKTPGRSPITRTTSLFLLLFALTACAGSEEAARKDQSDSSSVDESKPRLQSDGPLRGVVLAKGVNKQGSIVGPRLAFTTRDKQATAVIGLGRDAPKATLTVAWYRLVGAGGRQHLFSHKIRVGPGALAFSQGVAKGGLAPGLYETVATLGERQVRTPWLVRRRGSAALVSAPAADGASPELISSRSAQGTPSWDLPSPGESGVRGEDGLPLPDGERDTCEVQSLDAGWTPYTDLDVAAFWLGPCSMLTLSAGVTGALVPLGSEGPPLTGPVTGQADLCGLPGGSDLPGTVIRIEATGSAIARQSYVLEDHGETLTAGVEAIPAEGSNVAAGERIKLHALALVAPPAQGIKVLYVDDGNDLIESVGNVSGSTEPVSCDPRRYLAELFAEYQVPADPPPVIEICANAEGFDDVRARDCIEFYTGERWEGTLNADTSRAYHGGGTCTDSWEGELSFVVDDKGAIEGDGRATLEDVSCPYPFNPAREHVFSVGGEAGKGTFVLRLSFGRNIPRDGHQVAGFSNLLVTNAGQAGGQPPGPPIEVRKLDDCNAKGEATLQGRYGGFEDPTVARTTIELTCPSVP